MHKIITFVTASCFALGVYAKDAIATNKHTEKMTDPANNPHLTLETVKHAPPAPAEHTNLSHINDTIVHLTEVRGELLKEMKNAKDEASMLESAKHILDIDEAIVTLHAIEKVYQKAEMEGDHSKK
jgi:hypothetical protein